jgi:hypothetical protein
MKYIRLSSLSNTYPQPGNYIRKITANALAYDFTSGDSVLYGLYPETNQIPFYLPNLNAVRVIDDVSFRFILKVKKYPSDEYPSYFTGFDFYRDLESSIEAGNPYFINTAVKNSFMVEFDLLESLRYFKELQNTEDNIGVRLLQNNFIKFISAELIQEISSQQITEDASAVNLGIANEGLDFVNELQTNPYLELIDEDGIYVDYRLLCQYIDWVIQTPNLVELDNGGVIPPEQLTKYYETPEQPEITTPIDVVENENKKVIADVLDKNSEITNPGGGGYKYEDGQIPRTLTGGGRKRIAIESDTLVTVNEPPSSGGGGEESRSENNYRNRREYR